MGILRAEMLVLISLVTAQIVLVDVPALALTFATVDVERGWFLRVAKWHGFAFDIAVLLVVSARLRNLTSSPRCIARCECFDTIRRVFFRHGDQHAVFSVRALFSATIHVTSHLATREYAIAITNSSSPFVVDTDGIVLLRRQQPQYVHAPLLTDTYVWSGFVLLVLMVVLCATGRTLAARVRNHWRTLQCHRSIHVVTMIVLAVHHRRYAWPATYTALWIVDWSMGVWYSRRILVTSVARFPYSCAESPVQLNDTVELAFSMPTSGCYGVGRPGDYVRVKVPAISNVEWHDFTLVNDDRLAVGKRLVVRSVGTWTRSLYNRAAPGLSIHVKGPFNRRVFGPTLEERIIRGERVFRRLFLVSTGTFITRVRSFLEKLLPRYLPGSISENDRLPSTITLVWVVGSAYDINFNLRSMLAYREAMRAKGLGHVLRYDVHASNADELHANNDRDWILAERRCSMILDRQLNFGRRFDARNFVVDNLRLESDKDDENAVLVSSARTSFVRELRDACYKHSHRVIFRCIDD